MRLHCLGAAEFSCGNVGRERAQQPLPRRWIGIAGIDFDYDKLTAFDRLWTKSSFARPFIRLWRKTGENTENRDRRTYLIFLTKSAIRREQCPSVRCRVPPGEENVRNVRLSLFSLFSPVFHGRNVGNARLSLFVLFVPRGRKCEKCPSVPVFPVFPPVFPIALLVRNTGYVRLSLFSRPCFPLFSHGRNVGNARLSLFSPIFHFPIFHGRNVGNARLSLFFLFFPIFPRRIR